MTESQFFSLQNIYLLVAQVGSSLGAEATSSGLVIPTKSDSLIAAIEEFFPSSYKPISQEFQQFIDRFCQNRQNPELEDFLAYLNPLLPEFALVGNADFHPQGQDRGEFFLCVFVGAIATAGTNLLICFPRAET